MSELDHRVAPGALHRAVTRGDHLAARRLLEDSPANDAAALDALARLAASDDDGSGLAIELFVERLDASGIIRRFAHGALLDASAVDDVTQDSLISIATAVRSFRGSSKVTTWVHRIVRNRVVDHLRRQRATSPLPADDLAPAERMSSMIATRTTVLDALAALADPYREPVNLRDLEGLSYAEIAERLDRSAGTVKSQVSRGRALVAASLRGTGLRGDDLAPEGTDD